MKKLALCFFGFHYHKYLHWKSKKYILIDYKKSFQNYQDFIINYFENLGFEIDIFFSTYTSEKLNQLILDYQPKKFLTFDKIIENKDISRNTHFRNVLNLVINYQEENKFLYDNILITRFDILFKIPFEQVKIDLDKFNLISHLEPFKLIDDNFYLIPQKYLKKILYISLYDKSFHFLEKKFKKQFNLNFLKEEGPIGINHLSFYSFIRNFL
jgi:hypothetical protein